jgi:hypothetical protein
MASNFLVVEQIHVDATSGESLHVGRRGLPFRAGKGVLDRRHVVEMQDGDQMNSRRAGGVAIGPLLTSYFLSPGMVLASGTCLSK